MIEIYIVISLFLFLFICVKAKQYWDIQDHYKELNKKKELERLKKEEFEMNLNNFAVQITNLEGGKKQLNIAQIKSAMGAMNLASNGKFYELIELYMDSPLYQYDDIPLYQKRVVIDEIFKKLNLPKIQPKDGKYQTLHPFRKYASLICQVERGTKEINIAQMGEVLKIANKLTKGLLYIMIKRLPYDESTDTN